MITNTFRLSSTAHIYRYSQEPCDTTVGDSVVAASPDDHAA